MAIPGLCTSDSTYLVALGVWLALVLDGLIASACGATLSLAVPLNFHTSSKVNLPPAFCMRAMVPCHPA